MNKREIYEKLKQKPYNIRFEEMCKDVIEFGFSYKGGRGSHRIYAKQGIREILNFQNVKGMVKPYQVRQFIKIIERHHLVED
jgi:predicted RNA binding protein YcfA (HicA-like mRNA interferase family)